MSDPTTFQDPPDVGSTWFWSIVNASGIADLPSDEMEAIRILCDRTAQRYAAVQEAARLREALSNLVVYCEYIRVSDVRIYGLKEDWSVTRARYVLAQQSSGDAP